ncbi:MAG: glycosyltransferase family 4 protein [Thiobacillus sp.]|nr:glycosyltransferase family 4 protein [Thiobacillus sp.]
MSTLIGALLERDHEVVAITSGGFEATRNCHTLSLKGKNFEFHCCPIRRHSFRPSHGRIGRILDFYAYERDNLTRVLEEVRPDFVHAHWTYEYALAAIGSGVPHLVTAHDDPLVVLKLFRNLFRFGRYLMARQALGRASALSAVSPVLQTRLSSYTAIPIEVIPNPLSQSFQVAGQPRAAPTKDKPHRFISVQNGWVNLKNGSTALRAFALIRRELPHATYHLFGVHYEPEGQAHTWARKNRLAEGVVFHGPMPHEQLIQELLHATVMLHPSRWESCPMGIAEAMALGLPVVGGRDSGGVAWMVGEGGLVVDINRAEDIAAAAIHLASEEALYERCSAGAIKRVRAFSPDLIAEKYENSYRKAIEDYRVSK